MNSADRSLAERLRSLANDMEQLGPAFPDYPEADECLIIAMDVDRLEKWAAYVREHSREVAKAADAHMEDLPPEGITVGCVSCRATAFLPRIAPDRVSIAPMEGWTAPPPRCPDCTAAREALRCQVQGPPD